jgi:hypothetical protein
MFSSPNSKWACWKDGVMPAVEGQRPNRITLLIGDFTALDDTRRIAGARRRESRRRTARPETSEA